MAQISEEWARAEVDAIVVAAGCILMRQGTAGGAMGGDTTPERRLMNQAEAEHDAASCLYQAPKARIISNHLLEKCAGAGELQFTSPDVLKARPVSDHGNGSEFICQLGGMNQFRNAGNQPQSLLYAG